MITSSNAIKCQVCQRDTHSVVVHLNKFHPEFGEKDGKFDGGVALEEYKKQFPNAPVLSEWALQKLEEKKKEKEEQKQQETNDGIVKKPIASLFRLTNTSHTTNARGEPITVSVFGSSEFQVLVPDIDDNYVFDAALIKVIANSIDLPSHLNHFMPLYLWGYHGTGKTTAIEQFCARTNRPCLRVQHTVNTEESHIVGQWTVRDGSTEYQLGPLAEAMLNGWVYIADEYDFALPTVLSVYQPVLEGRPLVIKDAPSHLRVIRPHRHFRFAATGNTNGNGDETGLYQGAQIQNAANYSRFAIVEEVRYMPEDVETQIVMNQSGMFEQDARKLVAFANEVRKNYPANIGTTISPRELINIALIATMHRVNWSVGLNLGFINRLSRTDQEVARQVMQRYFAVEC